VARDCGLVGSLSTEVGAGQRRDIDVRGRLLDAAQTSWSGRAVAALRGEDFVETSRLASTL
jgi:predicted secreted protein